MADMAETTFAKLQMDERYKRLERTIKLASIRKEHGNSIHSEDMPVTPTCLSISTINGDVLDSSFVNSPTQVSRIESEVIASSNNLRNALFRKKYSTNQKPAATSSIKQYNVKKITDNKIDQFIMPSPMTDDIYPSCTSKTQANNFPVRNESSCISINTNNSKEYLHSFVAPMAINGSQRIDRVFSKWKVILNDQSQLIIKGTLECGKIARSKPVMKRLSATCVESIYRHRYGLQGNIVDERNELPDYILGKFYNGFPDDWENIYQIWKTFVKQGSQVTFRWPTPITDSDDDLKSEISDLTCIYVKPNMPSTAIKSYRMIEPAAQLTRTASNKFLEKKQEHNRTYNALQNHEESQLPVEPLIFDTEKDTKVKNANIEDNLSKQNIKMNVSVSSSCNPKKTNTLKDILQEDKLNIIINNLTDKNCSPKYINKIIEMLDCLEYVMLHNAGSESVDSTISTSQERSECQTIPPQQIVVHNKNNSVNTNKSENIIESKNCRQFSALENRNVKHDNFNSIQSPHARNIKPECDNNKNSDELESEIYAGIPKISIERVLQARRASRRMYKHSKKKAIHQRNVANSKYNAKVSNIANHMMVATSNPNNIQRNLAEESCISITEDEIDIVEKDNEIVNSIQKPQELTFISNQQLSKDNIGVYAGNATKPINRNIQNKQFFNNSHIPEILKDRSRLFIKEYTMPKIQDSVNTQFTDVDYITNSDNGKNTSVLMTMLKATAENNRIPIASHTNSNQNMINGENNANVFGEPRVVRNFHKEVVNQSNETVMMKPTVINSIPVNLNLHIKKNNLQSESYDSDISIVGADDKHCMKVRPMEERSHKKKLSGTSITKPSIIAKDFHSKTVADNIKENRPISNNMNMNMNNNKTESNNIKSFNSPKSTIPIRQSKNTKIGNKDNPKALTAWMPKIVHNPKSKYNLGLVFEGKLVNEVGHVINRKFTTDIILKRISATLIETINHEFYELLGYLNDNKQVIPRELVKQCRNGCPSKIEEFCLTWQTLQNGHNTSIELLSVPISSRGRKILPPLCYWTGERVTMINNTPVYSAGNSQESSLTSLNESPRKTLNIKSEKKQKKRYTKSKSQKTTAEKQKLLTDANDSDSSGIPENKLSKPIEYVMGSTGRSENSRKTRKAATISKRKIAQQLTFLSTDSDEFVENNLSPQKHIQKLQIPTNANRLSEYNTKLRKRQKIDTSSKALYAETGKPKYNTTHCSPIKNDGHYIYTYHQTTSLQEDYLTDQVSLI